MTARIVLFGASGYTGGRTAEAMVARGLRPVLAGRDPTKLAPLAARLGALDTAHAEVADRTSIIELIGPGDVLVSTVGPFHRLGRPAIRSAIDVGAVYLDSSGEPPFIRSVYEVFGPDAEGSGAALLTAFGHDHVPGVLAAALAVRTAGAAARRVDIGYFGTGRGRRLSRGTLHSLLGVALEPGYAYRHGALRTAPTGSRLRTFAVAGRVRPGVSTGASEQFALPRFAPQLATVEVYRGWFGRASGLLHAASGVTAAVGRIRGARWAAGHVAELATRRVPAAPAPAAQAASSVQVIAEVFDGGGTLLASTRVVASEAYGITAGLLAWGAGRAAEGGVGGVGALDAVSAFGLDPLSRGAAEVGLEIHTEMHTEVHAGTDVGAVARRGVEE